MGPLRDVLREPDRRTWRRFLPAARGAHRPTPSEPATGGRHLPDDVEAADPGRGSRAWQVVAGILILAAGIVLATGLLPAEPGPRQEDLAALHPSAPDPTEAEAPVSTTASTSVRVWPMERVEVAERIVRTDAGRWEVGADGDVLAIGDWDCDRSPTPAVLRRADGRIAVFDRWATDDVEETARPIGVVAGAETLQPARTCGEVVVRTASGEETVLDTRTSPAEGGR